MLPRIPRTKQHHRALHYCKVPSATQKVRQSTADPVTKLSFEFLVLTAARSGEVRLATWDQIDWDERKWTAPAEHMKARRAHKVPLSKRALEVLRLAEGLSDGSSDLVFPGLRGKPLSDMVFTSVLRRLEIPAVAHGFRSSFKNWCTECANAQREASETALAHNLGNPTQQSYARTDLFEPRRELMEMWADFVGTSNVPPGTTDRKSGQS